MNLPRFRFSDTVSKIDVFIVGPACGVVIATVAVAVIALLTPQVAMSAPYCGDAVCNNGENYGNCPIDCPPDCGNGVCEDGENTQWCFADCQCVTSYCGDGYCLCGELAAACSDCCDAAVCGNGSCELPCGENWVSCVPDCGDYDPPVTTAALSGTLGTNDWYTSPVTVTLTATDSNSGVFITYLDGTAYVGPRSYSADGAMTIAYQSRDAANNLEELKSTAMWIDSIPPVSTFAAPSTSGGWVGGLFTLAGTSIDETSGVARVEISFDAGATWQNTIGGAVWAYEWDTRALANGSYSIWIRGVDQAGNIETPVSVTTAIDRSAPFFDVGPFPPEYCFTCSGSGPLTFTLTAFDDESKISNSAIVVKKDGKDIRVLKAPNGELRGVPVVWDGKDEQGNPVPVGDYQLLFYTANRAGLYGSYGANFRVIDAQPVVSVTGGAPLVPMPTGVPWIMTPRPPTPTATGSAATIETPQPTPTGAPQVAAVPETDAGDNGSPPDTGDTSPTGETSSVPGAAAGASAAVLLAAAAAYIAAQQSNNDGSLGQKLAGLAAQYTPPAKPAAPPVPVVAAPPDAPPPPPPPPPLPRPPRLYWWQRLGWPSYAGPAVASQDDDVVAAYTAADYPTGIYTRSDGTIVIHISGDDCAGLVWLHAIGAAVCAVMAILVAASIIGAIIAAIVILIIFIIPGISIAALNELGPPGFNFVYNPSKGSWTSPGAWNIEP